MTGTATAQTSGVRLLPFDVGSDAYTNSMSRNGLWATFQPQADAGVGLEFSVIDMTTGQLKPMSPKKMIDYQGKEQAFSEGSYSLAAFISNDGQTIGGTVDGYPAYYTVADGTWHCLSMGDRQTNRNFGGEVYSMSDDLSVMCGWFLELGSMTCFKGGVWKNGELQTLPALPTYRDMYDAGILLPYQYEEVAGQTPNYAFRSLSSDGKKLLVSVDHNYPAFGCSQGVYDLENDTFSFITIPASKGLGFTYTDSAVMSNNGKFCTGTITFLEGDLLDVQAVFVYDTDTKDLQLFYDMADRDVLACAIDNNGTVYGATPASSPVRNTVIRSGHLWVNLDKTLSQKYGIDYRTISGFDTTGYPVGVSDDCKTMLTQAEFRGGALSLTLPETFDQAVQGVSLLTDYLTSPVSGSRFSRLNKVMIRFSYEAEPIADAQITVSDEEGNTVATSTSIESFSAQRLLYTINFPDTYMIAGKKYKVNIPAGTFVVPGTDMGCPAISVTYIGRADEPVEVTKVNPADGSYINEFSINSPVKLTYDAVLTLGNAVRAELYEEGKEKAICTLAAETDGNMLTLYPATSRKLSEGKTYKVVIPAGLVADLGQTGQNEAKTLTYHGTFVPQATQNGNYLFFDDINEPASSLSNFLLFDGDQRTPVSEMEAVGFDASNTPWNFSVRDESATDFAAMSHSMYTPAGQADDWMMIPQLEIPNADYFLTFKAQGFSQQANDVLKILVWEYDDVISSLDAQMMAQVNQEAVLFQDFTVTPALTEGILAGNWTNYEFSLSRFAGKKIYIAFVNQNNNQSAILLDDIGVEYRGNYGLYLSTPTSLVQADNVKVSGKIAVQNEGPFNDFSATLTAPGYSKEISASGLNLDKGAEYIFEFPEAMPLTHGEVNEYTVTTTLDGVKQVYKGKVSNHAFEIPRRVLIEEGTGTWCANCPRGEVALEHLEETLPDNVAIIAVHNGSDPFAFEEYNSFMAFGGYPAARINRLENRVMPLYPDPELGRYSYTSSKGDETYADLVYSQLEEGTPAEIKITDPVYYSADGLVNVPVTVRFSLSQSGKTYTVFTAVVEDDLHGRQDNGHVGSTDPLLEWWGAQPQKVSWTYNNVARDVIGGFFGISGRVPRDIVAGEEYTTELVFPVPSTVRDTANMKFVVALLDGATGYAANSDVCNRFEVNDTPGASVETIDGGIAVANARLEGGSIWFGAERAEGVYTLDGCRVANEHLAAGLYIARATNGQTAKVLVR